MLRLLVGVTAEYGPEARSPHERHDQRRRAYDRVADHPAVQGAAGVVRARVEQRVAGRRPEEQR